MVKHRCFTHAEIIMIGMAVAIVPAIPVIVLGVIVELCRTR